MQRHLVVPLTLNTGGSRNKTKKNKQHSSSTTVNGDANDEDDDEEEEQEDDKQQNEVPDITEQLVESIMDQAHLFPLPLQVRWCMCINSICCT